jgi:hypothetical protein
MDQSRELVAGWVGFYWGKTAQECRATRTIAGAMTASWLELFARKAAEGAAPRD